MGYHIPGGVGILHLHGLAHFEESRYPDPFQFNPERWLEGQAPRANAFGGGVHLCLGMGVTRLYVPLLLALLLSRFDLVGNDKPRYVSQNELVPHAPKTTRFEASLNRI